VVLRESNGPLRIQPKQQANVFANVFAISAADTTRFVRGVSHDIANTNHRTLEALLLGDGCDCAEASSGLKEDGEYLNGQKGQVGVYHPLSLNLDHPLCQPVKKLFGVLHLGLQ